MAFTGASLIVSGILAKALFAAGSWGASVFTTTAVLLTTGVAGGVAGPAMLRSSFLAEDRPRVSSPGMSDG
jgi:hypothetical protein